MRISFNYKGVEAYAQLLNKTSYFTTKQAVFFIYCFTSLRYFYYVCSSVVFHLILPNKGCEYGICLWLTANKDNLRRKSSDVCRSRYRLGLPYFPPFWKMF